MERSLKKLIISLIAFGTIVLISNVLVDNPYSHRFLQNAINEKAQKYSNLIFKFEAVKVHVLPPGIDLYGLEVAANNAPDRAIIRSRHAKTQLSLLSLLLGKLRLSLVRFDDLILSWPPPWGFPGFIKSQGPASLGPEPPLQWPLFGDLPVDRVVLENASIFADLQSFDGVPYAGKWLSISSEGSDLDISLDGLDDVEAQVAVASLNIALGANSIVENATLESAIELKKGKLSSSIFNFQAERLKLEQANLVGEVLTHGRDRRLDGFKLAIGGKAQSNLSLLGSILDLGNTSGLAHGDLRAELSIPIGADSLIGPDLRYSLEGNVKIEDGQLDEFRLYDSTASFRLNPDEITFPDIDLAIDGQSYGHLRGKIAFDDKVSFDFGGHPKALHLEDLLAIFNVDFRTFDFAMTSSDLSVKGTGDPLAIDIAATVLGQDINLPDHALTAADKTFASSPDCLIDLNLRVTSEEIDFTKTRANCYQQQEQHKDTESRGPQNIKPPLNAHGLTQLSADGEINTSQNKINLKIDIPEFDASLAQYFAQQKLAGHGSGSVLIHGPFDDLDIDLRSSIREAAPLALPLGTIDSFLTIKSNQLVLHEATVIPSDGGQINLRKGSLSFDNRQIAFEAAVESISSRFVGDILRALQVDPHFAVGIDSLQAQLSGPLQHPLAWQGKASFTLANLSLDQELLLDKLKAHVVSDLRGIRIHDALASKGASELGFSIIHQRSRAFSPEKAATSANPWLQLGLDPSDHIAIDFATPQSSAVQDQTAANQDHLGPMPYIGSLLTKAGIASQLAIQGRLSGPIHDLQGSISGKLHQTRIFGASFPDIHLKGFLNQSKLNVNFSHLGSVIEGRISLNLLETGLPYEWYINLNGLDVRAFATQYFYSDPRNFAYINAKWDMKGRLLDWWRSTGELAIEDIRAKYVRDVAGQMRTLSLKQTSPVRLLFSPNGWRFEDDKDLILEGKYLTMRLSLPDCRPPDRLSLKLDANVELGVAREFSTLVDTASGKINVIAEIIGPVSDPDLVVELTDVKPKNNQETAWQTVSFGITEARPALKDMQMRIFYAGGRLVIDNFTATKGTGNIHAAGTINLDSRLDDQSHLDINLDNATFLTSIALLKSFETQISGNLALTGSALPYRLAGDLAIVRARTTEEVDIRNEIINALRANSITASVVKEQAWLDLDLNVTADRSINIQNRSIQTALSTNLQIRGTDVQPSVTGQIDVDKGKFVYKRDFVIERGIVSFDDPIKSDPALDILAVSDVNDYRIYISITGRASQPVIEFAADPPTRENGSPISKVEILILLSRGSLPEENRSIGETQSAATSEALNLIMGQFEEPVEKLFDLSGQSVVRNIYFDTYPSSEGNPVPRLNLPLELGKDFDLVLRTDPSTEEVSGEYNLHENINFSASWERKHAAEEAQETNQTGDTKLNLKFRFNFE